MTADTQPQLMAFDPATGEPRPYPSHAGQWREYHGTVAWLFNPWTGTRRLAADVGTDPLGRLTQPEGLALHTAYCVKQFSDEEVRRLMSLQPPVSIFHQWCMWPDGEFRSGPDACDHTDCPKASPVLTMADSLADLAGTPRPER